MFAEPGRRGISGRMECRCDSVTELHGSEAEAYAGTHLHRDETTTAQFSERYACPDTGTRWLLEYPERTEREPGPARLRVEPGLEQSGPKAASGRSGRSPGRRTPRCATP